MNVLIKFTDDDGKSTSEVWLEKGSIIKLTSDPDFKFKCSNNTIYLDYKNIAKVCFHIFKDKILWIKGNVNQLNFT